MKNKFNSPRPRNRVKKSLFYWFKNTYKTKYKQLTTISLTAMPLWGCTPTPRGISEGENSILAP